MNEELKGFMHLAELPFALVGVPANEPKLHNVPANQKKMFLFGKKQLMTMHILRVMLQDSSAVGMDCCECNSAFATGTVHSNIP